MPSAKSSASIAVEMEDGPALESHPQVAAIRLDSRDVAEARHERPTEVDLALPMGDLEPEDLERPALLQLLGRHVGDPGILVLKAVKVIAPERLLVATPTQPSLVGDAVVGGEAAVEEALVVLRGHRPGRCSDRGRGRRGAVDVLLADPASGGEGEKDEHDGDRPSGDCGSRHGLFPRRKHESGRFSILEACITQSSDLKTLVHSHYVEE